LILTELEKDIVKAERLVKFYKETVSRLQETHKRIEKEQELLKARK
jgi:hypothetical protein